MEALKPAFSRLLAADGWLPEAYASPDLTSGMGGGIGQYALYREVDLCLFSLVIPAGAETPVHDPAARRYPFREDGVGRAVDLDSPAGP